MTSDIASFFLQVADSATTQLDSEVTVIVFGNRLLSIFARVGNPDGRKSINAAEAGNKDRLKKRLDKEQVVDTSSILQGMTALAEASRNGHDACVKLLLDHGANPAFTLSLHPRFMDRRIALRFLWRLAGVSLA
ncbi:hypothetical protein OIDMADRAFT_181885 [Oidiodendron maius Zn]|uniref:Uncharacterized protein n=1 Tax=Oidiodendron maius (strain Zn) TaxID=913774 RepID=A0A0C3GRB4_OIDMZ|nr:hypothetical protein OIDMADRAFT_181885 [Oidiodendron maius Zn]